MTAVLAWLLSFLDGFYAAHKSDWREVDAIEIEKRRASVVVVESITTVAGIDGAWIHGQHR